MNQPYSASEVIFERRGLRTRLQMVCEGVIRVTHTRRDAFLPTQSAIVIRQPEGLAEITEDESVLRLCAGPVSAVLTRETGAIAFYDAQGSLLLREPDRRPHQLEEKPVLLHCFDNAAVQESQSIDGARASAEPVETYEDRTAYECRQSFVFAPDEGLYGLGSHEEGYGNLRGKSRLLYQHNMKAVVPVLVSTRGWGILFDMGCMMAFHDDEEGSYLWADCADELDWYFFYGDGSYTGCMARYAALTGPSPMLPRYALGFIQSKERYVSADELLEVSSEYRRRGVPLDMIVLDWQSWPEGQWGWKHFDPQRFPDPAGLTQRLHDMDLHLMVSIWPSMQGEQNADRAAMLEHGYMLGNRLIYNAFDPEARKLYWQQASQGLFQYGVDAWWCDCSEPFESDWHGAIKPEPFRRAQLNTDEAKRYLDPTRINLYSLYHSRGIYEGQRGECCGRRVCNLTRSSYAGQHRYATITWSGDVSANWETLRRHIPEGMNFCATGEPFWSTDIGGFFTRGLDFAWFFSGDYDGGVDDLGYRELFVRWAQYAACLPMMRAHGSNTPREIWRFGRPGEPFYDALEQTIRLRYHLVPYLYTLMASAAQTGAPMLRVPALVFQQDAALRCIDDEMMLGDAILVKPVTRPMYYQAGSQPIEATDEVSVRLPAGHGWYDLAGSGRYDGGQEIVLHAPLARIPMLVRSGAILPWGQDAESTAGQAPLPVEIVIFPGEDGAFTLYQDAGDGYGYEQGEAALTPFVWDDGQNRLTIGRREGGYPGMPEQTVFLVHRFGRPAQQVVYRGEPLSLPL